MPKKSILKKRADVEPISRDPSPQVDNFSSTTDVISVGSAGDGKSADNNNVTTESRALSPVSLAVKMGLLQNRAAGACIPSAAATVQKPESPPTRGITPNSAVPASWRLLSSTKAAVKGKSAQRTDGPKVTPYSSTLGSLLKKNAATPQSAEFSTSNAFPEQKAAAEPDSRFLLPHVQDPAQSPLPNQTPDPKQRSSTEIEDEERFLYGDEEEKKLEPPKAPPPRSASAPPAKSSPSKQEFEKISDLLKTIGLDIGVAEIGKLAVRTEERLHGKKALPKISQPHSAATASPAKPSEPRVKTENKEEVEAAEKTKPPVKPAPKEPTPPVMQQSPAPFPKGKPRLILRKPLPKETPSVPKVEIPVHLPPPSPVPNPTPPPMSPSHTPIYNSYPQMVPGYNMPPPNYNPYASYVSYPTSNWMYTTMAPQPSPTHMQTPPHMSVPVSTPSPVYNPRSNLRVIETTDDISEAKTEVKPTTPLSALLAKQGADRKNKETEKMKVLEELDYVRKEHKVKSESLKTLSAKVEQLRVQQGLLLRKKRREKDGHKDPLLEELNNVLESAQKQIHSLCEEINVTKQKQQQLTKVAEILGVSPTELIEKSEPKREERRPCSPAPTRDSDNYSRTSSDFSKSANDFKTSGDPASKIDLKAKSGSKSEADAQAAGAAHFSYVTLKSEDVKCKGAPPVLSPDPRNSPEPRSPYSSKSEDVSKSRDKSRSKSPRPSAPSSQTLPKSEEPPPFDISQIFEYYDSGSHWCEGCNAICMTLPEFLLHFHDKKHNQSVKETKRPWVKKKAQEASSTKKQKVNIPLKGPEFLVPVNGFYCELCDELFPDHTAAAEHLRAYAHNDKYKKHTDAHMNYEAVRREKKKASLTAAQEVARKQAEQKRKMAEQKHEAHEHSKSKKAKKEEQEEERKVKSKHHTSPPSSDHKPNKTPEREPPKNPTFGKFIWKAAENKPPAGANSSGGDDAANKPKEEDPKALSLKPKGFAIKLLGKPSTLPGNALSPSHSTTVTSTAPSSFVTSATSTAQTKVRPNLPSLMNMRLATPAVTMSKPAPLNTFLSIRSSNATSKSIPIVGNKPTGVFPEDLVSKAFGGEVVNLKEGAQPDSAAKTENETSAGQSPKAVQTIQGQDLMNVTVSKKETLENQEVKSEKDSPVPKQSLTSCPQKSSSTSHTTITGPTKPAPVQHMQSTRSPAPSPAPSSLSNTTSAQSANSPFNDSKSDSAIIPSNQQTSKAGLAPRREESDVQQPQESKSSSKSEKEAPQEIKASTFSMNPMTGRLEYLPVQHTKVQDTNVQKSPETKHKPTPVSYVSSVKPSRPACSPPVPVLKPIPTYSATTKLNQKFKKAPLTLPSSLFGHVQDAGYKDIKITSVDSQKTNNRADKSESPLLLPAQKNVSPEASAMQQELDSYYKLIASEEDPEDLTTSEDQDSEAAPTPTGVTGAPRLTGVESPEKKVKLVSALPPVRSPIRPVILDVSGEEVDDSDMACEVPEVSFSSASQTSGWNFMQSSYASIKVQGSSSRQPLSFTSRSSVTNQDKCKEATLAAAVVDAMEDLSVYVTCDSD
ncbi:zinc finger protein 318 [Rhinoderma darwinii]|uniref:zinc finger protein 318 n=1 Tax=Rhinoderma darwinii TaxID=43563 RepID=UPI003F667743